MEKLCLFTVPASHAFPSSFAGYPGGPFDPLNLTKEAADDWKLKEIKNGRLAMMAFMGFVAQYAATGKGPIDNLFDVGGWRLLDSNLDLMCAGHLHASSFNHRG